MSPGLFTTVAFVNDDVTIEDIVRVAPDLKQIARTPPVHQDCNMRTVVCDPALRQYRILESRYDKPDDVRFLRAPEYIHNLTEVIYQGTDSTIEQVSVTSLERGNGH